MEKISEELAGATWNLTDQMWFYKQHGGCVEIGQRNQLDDYQQDLIHVCSEDVPDFLRLFTEFVNK